MEFHRRRAPGRERPGRLAAGEAERLRHGVGVEAAQSPAFRTALDAGRPVPITAGPTLADGLALAGFDRRAPAFFSWLGVTMYLTDEAIESTLRFVASTPAGGGLVFDYAVPRAALGWMSRLALRAISRRVAAAGEPFRTFFDPEALSARLASMGFRSIENLGSEELNRRYFSAREDGLRSSGGLGRLLSAEI